MLNLVHQKSQLQIASDHLASPGPNRQTSRRKSKFWLGILGALKQSENSRTLWLSEIRCWKSFPANFDAAGKLLPDFPAVRNAIPAKVWAFSGKENGCWKVGPAFGNAAGFSPPRPPQPSWVLLKQRVSKQWVTTFAWLPGITVRCQRDARCRQCTGKKLSRTIWSSFNKERISHLCDSTVAGPTAWRDNVLATANPLSVTPLLHVPENRSSKSQALATAVIHRTLKSQCGIALHFRGFWMGGWMRGGLDLQIWGAPFLPQIFPKPFKTSIFTQIGGENGAPRFCRSNPPRIQPPI